MNRYPAIYVLITILYVAILFLGFCSIDHRPDEIPLTNKQEKDDGLYIRDSSP